MNTRQQLLEVASGIFHKEREISWFSQKPSDEKIDPSMNWIASTGEIALTRVTFSRRYGRLSGITAARFTVLYDTDVEASILLRTKSGSYEDVFSQEIILPAFEQFLECHDHNVCLAALAARIKTQEAA